MITSSKFVERLNELISEHGITQKELAINTKLTETSISEYTRGISEPSLNSLTAIADYFKCTTDYLTGNANDSTERKFLKRPPFHERINFLLNTKDCSGYYLCKKAEIPQGSFYDWKNGKTEPAWDNLNKLLAFFDCSLDYLLGREA